MAALHDTHCHLDFMANGEQVAAEARAAGSLIFANSVTPEGYDESCRRFGAFENVQTGLGLHPWWIAAETIADYLDAFEQRLPQTRFVGEIGLDFGRRGEGTRELQVAAFERVAHLCAVQGGKLISIHAVRSAETALDILEKTGALSQCDCIFHWFLDSSAQLARARRAGCYFSVNPMMAATKRGREYIRAIKLDHLLLETDAPPERGKPYPYGELATQLQAAADAVSAAHGTEALELIAATAEHLLANDGTNV